MNRLTQKRRPIFYGVNNEKLFRRHDFEKEIFIPKGFNKSKKKIIDNPQITFRTGNISKINLSQKPSSLQQIGHIKSPF